MLNCRRAWVWIGLATAVCCAGGRGAAAGDSGIAFRDATSETGLVFLSPYGPTFATAKILPETAVATLQRNLGNGAAVGDYDGDGDLDVYLLGNLGVANVLYRNELSEGSKTFTDVSSFARVGDTGLSRVAHFVDLDNDGDLDLLVVNEDDGGHPSRVFRNDGDGRFSDVSEGSGFTPAGYMRCGAAIADFDQDGLLDVYVTNWSGQGIADKPQFPYSNRLYRNLGNFIFADVTEAVGLGGLLRDSFSAIFTDFSGDGRPDLFVAIDHTSDEFYRSTPSGFDRVTELVGTTHVGNDMGVACADFDDDGDLDLYATNITDPLEIFADATERNVFYVQQGQAGSLVFEDEAVERGVGDTYWGWGTEFVDVENDGDLDLISVTGFYEVLNGFDPDHPLTNTPSVLFVNDSTGHFERVEAAGMEFLDDSRALIAFDFDRDGDEDVLITNVDQPARLLENVTESTGHYLDLALVQRFGANRSGIGVAVYATTGSVTRRRDLVCGDSYLSGTPKELHFGLGEAATVDEIRVAWTDGSMSRFADVAADRFIRIYQAHGDANRDGTVGLDDFEALSACEQGVGPFSHSDCDVFDFDIDADVDLLDFGAFQREFAP